MASSNPDSQSQLSTRIPNRASSELDQYARRLRAGPRAGKAFVWLEVLC